MVNLSQGNNGGQWVRQSAEVKEKVKTICILTVFGNHGNRRSSAVPVMGILRASVEGNQAV